MRNLLLAVLLTTLYGCATPYQSSGLAGGYSHTQIKENIFQVSFRGNGYTGTEQASDFALLRAAELAVSNGYRYFVVAQSNMSNQVHAYTTPTRSTTTANVNTFGRSAYGTATTTQSGGNTYFFNKPVAHLTIVCFKENPDVDAVALDAAFIIKSIKEKYKLQ